MNFHIWINTEEYEATLEISAATVTTAITCKTVE